MEDLGFELQEEPKQVGSIPPSRTGITLLSVLTVSEKDFDLVVLQGSGTPKAERLTTNTIRTVEGTVTMMVKGIAGCMAVGGRKDPAIDSVVSGTEPTLVLV